MFQHQIPAHRIATFVLVLLVFFGGQGAPSDYINAKLRAKASDEQGSIDETTRELRFRISFCSSKGNFAGEQVAREELVSLLRKEFGGDHWRTVEAICYLESVQRTRKLNTDKQRQIAKARALYADSGRQQQAGHLQSALIASEKALKLYQDILGESDFVFVGILTRVGILQQSLGLYKDSKTSLTRALKLRVQLLGEVAPDNAALMNNLALVCIELDQIGEAEQLLGRALKICQKEGTDSAGHGIIQFNLARTYNLQKNFRKAESAATESIRIFGKMLPRHYPYYVKAQLELAQSYMGQQKYAEAGATFERVINIFTAFETNPPPALMRAEVFNGYAAALREMGNKEAAHEYSTKAAQLRTQTSDEVH